MSDIGTNGRACGNISAGNSSDLEVPEAEGDDGQPGTKPQDRTQFEGPLRRVCSDEPQRLKKQAKRKKAAPQPV